MAILGGCVPGVVFAFIKSEFSIKYNKTYLQTCVLNKKLMSVNLFVECSDLEIYTTFVNDFVSAFVSGHMTISFGQ